MTFVTSSPKYAYRRTNIIYFVSSKLTHLIYPRPTTSGSIQNPNTCYVKTSYTSNGVVSNNGSPPVHMSESYACVWEGRENDLKST
jgi:hypothetical protein